MDESVSEKSTIIPKTGKPGFTRREFLKKGVTAGAFAGASIILARSLEEKKKPGIPPVTAVPILEDQEILRENPVPVIPASVFQDKNIQQQEDQPKPTATLLPTSVPQIDRVKDELKKEITKQEVKKDSIFSSYSQDETKIVESLVERQLEHYKKEPAIEKRKADTAKWRNTVAEAVVNLGFEGDSIVPEYMLGLIYVESGGDPKAKTSFAEGVCQLQSRTALEIVEKMKIDSRLDSVLGNLKFKDKDKKTPDLTDPKTNIILSLEYMDRLFKLFPDPALAFQTYHLGEVNMARAIRYYLIYDRGLIQGDVDKVIDDPSRPGTAELVKQYNLNWVKIMTSKQVTDRLKQEGRFENDTQFYVPRLEAAKRILAETV